MNITDILLSTTIPIKKETPLEVQKLDQTYQKQEQEVLNKSTRNFIQELESKLINQQIYRLLSCKNENKEYFSATEIIECPKLLWYKLKGRITKDMIDTSKIFPLLDLYARMGDTVHNYIYKNLNFQYTEQRIVDKENCISGKFDIYDHGVLIDIKSSKNPYDVSPQLSIYYHLVNNVKKLHVTKVYVWWVLNNKFEEYELEKLKVLYPKYIHRAKMMKNALKENTYPESLGIDETSCKYCLIESWCKHKNRSVHNNHTTRLRQNYSKSQKQKERTKLDIIDLL